MKPYPKFINQYLPPSHVADLIAKFEEVKVEAGRRLKAIPPVPDRRKGFGTVYATGPIRRSSTWLTGWNWRHPRPENYAEGLGAKHFADDPVGAVPTSTLGSRTRVAMAFAEAANTMFDPDDIRFIARPLEVVPWDGRRSPGIYPGDDGDTLVIDLMLDASNSKVIDAMVREQFWSDRGRGDSPDPYWMQLDVWDQVIRLNAAREMLAPGARMVHFPDRSSIRRRMGPHEVEAYGHTLWAD